MKNVSASIRAKLLNKAKGEHIPFQRILTLYKQEGLLHRIVLTKYSNEIVLKGGLLFFQLQGFTARPTKDIDLLGSNVSHSETKLRELLLDACVISLEDGLRFDVSSIEVSPITGQTDHGGIKGWITAYLGESRTRLQLDVGFGDVITGGPLIRPYRTLLGNRSFSIQTYSDETVAAEKLEALVSLGTINSRYKDIYDLYELLIAAKLDNEKVIAAACNTFINRNTVLPEMPESLTEPYWASSSFMTDWKRYLNRIETTEPQQDLLIKNLLPKLQSIYSSIRVRVLKQIHN